MCPACDEACDCRTPLSALEKELCLSRREVETLITAINSTMDESKRIERDLISIQVEIQVKIYYHERESLILGKIPDWSKWTNLEVQAKAGADIKISCF